MEDCEIIRMVRNVERGGCYALHFMVENRGYERYNCIVTTKSVC